MPSFWDKEMPGWLRSFVNESHGSGAISVNCEANVDLLAVLLKQGAISKGEYNDMLKDARKADEAVQKAQREGGVRGSGGTINGESHQSTDADLDELSRMGMPWIAF